MNHPETPAGFFGLGIAPGILRHLDELGFHTPTPIQAQAIPVAVTGEDVVGIAQTGTGKTFAFAIPMLQRIAANACVGLVLAPTRELALQIDESLVTLGRPFKLRTAVLIGGAPMYLQKKMIARRPHIIIATPGRLNDHLEQKTITLERVCVLVLDEADRMLDMGFEPQIRRILKSVPTDRQTMLFSATMPPKISHIAQAYMKKPLRVEVAPQGTAAERIEQEVFIVPKDQKLGLLRELLKTHRGTVLVFSRTKHGAKRIARGLEAAGHTVAELHANRSLPQRRAALAGFKSGKYRVLVATDIAARGIDVMDIELVVNFDLPSQTEDYVHRIGRTGRAGRAGKAVSFAAPEEQRDVAAIERLIRTRLPQKRAPGLMHATAPRRAPVMHQQKEQRADGGRHRAHRRRGGRQHRRGRR